MARKKKNRKKPKPPADAATAAIVAAAGGTAAAPAEEKKVAEPVTLASPTSTMVSAKDAQGDFKPTNSFVCPLLTDLYQITMAYGYWKNGKQNQSSVFDLFFRKSPFKGEYTIFCGLEEALRFVSSFKFTQADIDYLKTLMPGTEEAFFDYLLSLNCEEVKVYAMQEGSVAFPKEPMLRLEGPLVVVQLLETTLLNLVNYPSLVATNAARHVKAAGPGKTVLEFGLRRAQGPDGGLSAAHYTYIGGAHGTSVVKAGALFGIPVKGTHAHSFISAFSDEEELPNTKLMDSEGKKEWDLLQTALDIKAKWDVTTNDGELRAFVAYALAFPKGFLALVDTYDTLNSGVINFLIVASSLHLLGFKAIGIRLDSGDLAQLSKDTRALFQSRAQEMGEAYAYFGKFAIVASNDINEKALLELNRRGHEVNSFGIGTHLVTCQAQPALGCVFKLVQLNGVPRIKLSNEVQKVTLPGRKHLYRLYGAKGYPVLDMLTGDSESPPKAGQKVLCKDPFDANKRWFVTPAKVDTLLRLVWDGKLCLELPSIHEVRDFCQTQLASLDPEITRPVGATAYKVAVTNELFSSVHALWQKQAPIPTLE